MAHAKGILAMVKVNYEEQDNRKQGVRILLLKWSGRRSRANQVIKGWTEALVHMPAGSVWEVYIPQQLAYGEREQVRLNHTLSYLIFKIESISRW